ncbi:hypothetical protein DICPUDRAFT_76826 [Dictyostelium purpureum]|uniref:Uncharacterized protein n=1 Tax=Dictyostelium purpureum TaxID=5786 RepID=F0ZER7_DICPU|nr:uncharacterized protein DICPUDRAFT_76826 [Dictyostelium purpureum]EGC37572.1 hypothetical protein DICPUDRAFT_76826 [Dictyostelium purpureum]|eukprot:XP_003285898.1 hypothetical protein DICPUDRAFT_76826 [Dictyostelium purpureum]
MPLKSKKKIKQCDPFFKGEVLGDKTSRDKIFKEKKSNSIPKSLRTLMEGRELIKTIENKRKLREQQEKKVQQNKSAVKTTTTTTITTTTAATAPTTATTTATNNTTAPITTTNKPINKKIKKENLKELDNINVDIKEDLKKLNSLYYQKSKEDVPDGVKEEDDILKTNLKKHKGEDHRAYLERINKEIAIKTKKNSSTYQKRKEYFDEKKLKEKLKKQGIRYSDYLEQQKREEEKRKEEEEDASNHGRKKKRRTVDDFDELKDNIKFNEQIERPPLELPTLKDFTNKKRMEPVDSAKRNYLWQDEIKSNSSNKNNQLLSSNQLEEEEKKRKQPNKKQNNTNNTKFDEEQELLKRNLELLKQKTLDNYKQSKNRKQQLVKINKEKEKEDGKQPKQVSNNSKQFYL